MKTIPEHLVELFNLPALIQNFRQHRQLIAMITWRDFRARYRGSLGGLIWAFMNPLVMMVVYTLVFSSFLKIKFGSSESPFAFAVYLLCGLLPWIAFSDSISSSTTLISANINLVKRVIFPLEVLPVSLVFVNNMQFLIGLIFLLPLAWLLNGRLYASLGIVPLLVVMQVILYVGVACIWSSLSVYFNDLRQVTPVLLTIVMFLTPIFYPIEIVPSWAVPIMKINPLASLITMYRMAIMEGVFPGYDQLLIFLLVSIIALMLGYFWFMHTKKGFADVL